jgi:hypothetical protein
VNTSALPAQIRYVVHPFQLTAEDRQRLQTESDFVPLPRVHGRSSASFRLHLDSQLLYVQLCVVSCVRMTIVCRHIQLLASGRCLLLVTDKSQNIRIYLEILSDLGHAVAHRDSKKLLHHERVGESPLIAFDETKRTLALYPTSLPAVSISSYKHAHGSLIRFQSMRQLYLFVFDERYTLLQALGSPIRLMDWYDEATDIVQMVFVCGSAEEIAFIDSTARVRVFSLVTQQFR